MNYYPNDTGGGPLGPKKICYQVDFNAVATGKVIAMSKRRIRWRFGFPNDGALASGKSGIDCRGEEHDVTLIWSISSGKRMLMSNGHQIYIGVNKSKGFEHIWHDKNGTQLKAVAHSTAPLSNEHGSRQYDLYINGKSFFTLPKVYEIGLRGSTDYAGRVPGVIGNYDRAPSNAERRPVSYSESGRGLVAPKSAEEEEEELQKAIKESLQESRQHLSARGKLDDESLAASTLTNTIVEAKQAPQPEAVAAAPLIDFFSEPTPAPAASSQALVSVPSSQQQYQVDPFAYNANAVPGASAAPMGTALTAPVQPNAFDEFAPQAPTYNDISSQILMGYSPHAPVAANPSSGLDKSIASSTVASSNPFDDPPVTAPAAHTSYAPNSITAVEPQMQQHQGMVYHQQPVVQQQYQQQQFQQQQQQYPPQGYNNY